jgi:hypothetical protein
MKKKFILMLIVMFSIVLGFGSCTSCGSTEGGDTVDSVAVDSVVVNDTINVEPAEEVNDSDSISTNKPLGE